MDQDKKPLNPQPISEAMIPVLDALETGTMPGLVDAADEVVRARQLEAIRRVQRMTPKQLTILCRSPKRRYRQRQQRLKRHGHCGRFDRCYR